MSTEIKETPTTYLSCAETAKLVRTALKDAFKEKYPEVKKMFSVRSDVYSMGASIHISWTDGPTFKEVEAVVNKYQGADFDGMQDMKIDREPTLIDGKRVRFGADYINYNRKYSLALVTAVAQAYSKYCHVSMPKIEESCGSAYVDDWKVRDEIMPLVYSCDGCQKDITICIYRGKFAIKADDMKECICCHHIATEIQYINNNAVCADCIKDEIEALSTEDLGLPADTQEAPIQYVTASSPETPKDYSFNRYRHKFANIYLREDTTEHLKVQIIEFDFVTGTGVARILNEERLVNICRCTTRRALKLANSDDTKGLRSEKSISSLALEMQQIREEIEMTSNIIDIRTHKPIIVTKEESCSQPEVKTTVSITLPKNEPMKDDVLTILKQGSVQGCNYHLPQIRLDRKMYVEVNEVLERIGGRWNRKAKTHVFEEDPTSLLDLIFETGEMPPKNPTAFFPTPAVVIEEMPFHLIPRDVKRILEPSAGRGNIAEALREYCQCHEINASIDCCEILPKFRDILRGKGFNVVADDFLQYQVHEEKYDGIFMNPPFSLDHDNLAYIAHIEHAWSLLADGGVLAAIAPSGLKFRSDKRTAAFRDFIEDLGEIKSLTSGSFADSGTGVNTVMVILQK